MIKSIDEISDIQSETGIIATLIDYPDYVFYSETLKPKHFSSVENGKLYDIIKTLASNGIKSIDAYNIISVADKNGITIGFNPRELIDFIEDCGIVARSSLEEYKMLVANVLDAAMRRELYRKLVFCENICLNENEKNVSEKIYEKIDGVVLEYSSDDDIPKFGDIIDDIWNKVSQKQGNELCGVEFKFPSLNRYVTIDSGELIMFGGQAKQGKSMLLMNCAVDLLCKGKKVLYIDSELSSETFAIRMLSHFTGIEYNKIRYGRYSPSEESMIKQALQTIKTWPLTHIYLPKITEKNIYVITKKVMHSQGIDVFILDYLKSSHDTDAYGTYQEMGKVADLIKNTICGDMGIAGLSAVQLTSTNKVADSANIERISSTVVLIIDKTPEEIMRDGEECGNKKLFVKMNRNGEQMRSDEYIDVFFNGNLCTFTEASQHKVVEPV